MRSRKKGIISFGSRLSKPSEGDSLTDLRLCEPSATEHHVEVGSDICNARKVQEIVDGREAGLQGGRARAYASNVVRQAVLRASAQGIRIRASGGVREGVRRRFRETRKCLI